MKPWLMVVALVGCLAIGFGSGLLVGRQFPAHHFERFGSSSYLLESTTGTLCNPFKNRNESANRIDDALGANKTPPSYDANGFQIAPKDGVTDLRGIWKTDDLPSCGK
jgi:hypothetical protein